MSAGSPFLVRHADLVFALKTFAAAALALVVALWIDLPRPYWAMATVYITSQPLAGATSSKAIYRVLGTVIGAIVTVAIVPNFVNAPELLCLVTAIWVGFCLYLSLLDRTPRSYVFMLTGYTVALIGFPAVSDPASIFDTAVARVEEITLGIICATLVSTTVLPRSVAPTVADRVSSWLSDARNLCLDVLSGRGAEPAHRAQRMRLATDAVEIDMLASHLDYDWLADTNAVRGLHVLRLEMLMLLPTLASISERMAALGNHLQENLPELACLIDNLKHWLSAEDTERQQQAETLRAKTAALRPKLDSDSSWEQITAANLLIRLRELVDISQACRSLSRAITTGDDVSCLQLTLGLERAIAPTRHRDHGMALWSGAGAAIAILICSAFWIATGWADGASAPMMAAVACSFFAAQDDPAPGIKSFGVWAVVSFIVVAIYLFAVIPAISNIEVLIAALAPPFLLFGVLIARPSTTFIGMSLASNAATLMALQEVYDADFGAYANSAVAFIVGIATATIVIKL